MIKSTCRGICFVTTAFLAAGFTNHYPWWFFIIIGGIVGVTAGIGWADEKDKS